MAIPSEDLIDCKACGARALPHDRMKVYCVPCARKRAVEYTRRHRERQKSKPRLVYCKGCEKRFDASKTGRVWRCADCTLAYNRLYAEAHKEKGAEYQRRYRAKLGNVLHVRAVKRRVDKIAQMTPEELAEFRKKESDKTFRLTAKLRQEVFTAYGGTVCCCCGETGSKFLSIDHIDNDGAEMRKSGKQPRGGTAFYQWLRKSGFPKGFQVLCMNCNVGKHRNGGICPHQSGNV